MNLPKEALDRINQEFREIDEAEEMPYLPKDQWLKVVKQKQKRDKIKQAKNEFNI